MELAPLLNPVAEGLASAAAFAFAFAGVPSIFRTLPPAPAGRKLARTGGSLLMAAWVTILVAALRRARTERALSATLDFASAGMIALAGLALPLLLALRRRALVEPATGVSVDARAILGSHSLLRAIRVAAALGGALAAAGLLASL